jgi:hypothetical protein
MDYVRRQQAALEDYEALLGSLRGISHAKIRKAYESLNRDARRYGSGNYARSRLDGMPRAKGVLGTVPRIDDYSAQLGACDNDIRAGLQKMQVGAAMVRAALARVDDLTGPLRDRKRGLVRCVGFGDQEAHWVEPPLAHNGDQLCSTCYYARWYRQNRATPKAEAADSNTAA